MSSPDGQVSGMAESDGEQLAVGGVRHRGQAQRSERSSIARQNAHRQQEAAT
ncbi:MAG: hypothetical protein LC775_17590 [Acidobacteria bacterium]|nr:hypothetical protein [Acidobacteriota bacterium]